MKVRLFILSVLIANIFMFIFDGKIFANSRSELKMRVFDAVVAIDGSGDYTTIQKAIDAAPAGRTAENAWLIFVKNGIYRELVNVPQEKSFIHLIGQDREKTIIHENINVQSNPENEKNRIPDANSIFAWEFSKNNPNSIMYDKNDGVVVKINGPDFYAENITFTNDWGVERKNGPQALAIMTYGDRVSFYNCGFRSFQDTWKTAREDIFRGYAKDCFIEGAVDYIYGTGNYYFETCTLYCVRDGSVIVAPSQREIAKWGYVFESCIIDGIPSQKTKFGRPWHNSPIAVFLNTTVKIGITPEGWTNMGGFPRYFSEYNTKDINGKMVNVSNRKKCYSGRDKPEETKCIDPVLTVEQAAKYTYSEVIGENDNWDPRLIFKPVDKPVDLKMNKNNELKWKTVPNAKGYIIYSNDKVIGFSRTADYQISVHNANVSYYVQAVNKHGSLGEKSVAAYIE